ncbi:MAG: hypothetical protein LBL08_00815 [Candidatus Nomurabacteria bacterium]|nr:hypothetical protein [Candidatus Nomurabacteria bacterium]
MRNFIKFAATIVLLLAGLVSLWFLFSNIQPIKPPLYLVVLMIIVAIGIAGWLFFGRQLKKLRAKKLPAWLKTTKFKVLLLIVIALIGIAARLFFYFKYNYQPTSDPKWFYIYGQEVANGTGLLGNAYVAFFPYLAIYSEILGFFMKIISDPWLATIILNTAFDLAGAIVVYFFVKALTKPGSKAPTLAFVLWTFSPFNTIFSAQALPIVIVNFFIILVVFLAYQMGQKIVKQKTKPIVILAILLGLALGAANWFRPIFVIFIIALFLYLLFIIFTNKRTKKLVLLSAGAFVAVCLIFTGFQKLGTAIVSVQTGLDVPVSSGGWSIYVGANQHTNGGWSVKDSDYRDHLVKEYSDCDIAKRAVIKCQSSKPSGLQAAHDRLQRDGIERYKSYGIYKTLSLFVSKLYRFSSEQNNMYNANQSFQDYKDSKVANLIGLYISLFITLLFAAAAIFLLKQAKNVVAGRKLISPVVILIAVVLLGFFLSDMFVEAARRYAQIMYPLFIILAVLFVDSIKRRKI